MVVEIKSIYPVWISMTTIPPRYDRALDNIMRILREVKGFDKLILNVPKSYKRFKQDPEKLRRIREYVRDPRFVLNVTEEDYGPITKIYPILDKIPRECVLVICDDEQYHPDAFSIAVEAQIRNRSKTFTYWKYDYNNIQVPQGVDIITFWSENIKDLKSYIEKTFKNEYCFYVDDMVIGSYLNSRGVHIDQLDRKWKWPWIPNEDNTPSLFGKSGKFNRDDSSRNCYNFLN